MTMTTMLSWSLWLGLCLSATITAVLSADPEPPTPPPNPQAPIQISHKIDGNKAILSCIVKDLGRRRIIWSRLSDPFPIALGTYRFHPSKKYRVQNQANTNILTIKDLTLQDAGEYECRVSGPFALKEVLSLNINAGPKSTYFLPTNRTITSSLNMTVVLPCKVEHLNDKMVMWKNGRNNVVSLRKKVYNGDSRIRVLHKTRPEWHLQIEKLRLEDFGYYTCMVNSDPVLTRTVELINKEPPHFAPVIKRDTNFRKKVEVMEGETVSLTCNFHAYPVATVKWYKRYKENGKTKKKFIGAEGNVYTLRSVKLEQSGDYVCIGRNGMKEGKAKTRLTVKAIPTTVPTTVATTTFIPSGPVGPHLYHEERRKGMQRGRNVELTCFAIGWPRPYIHWMRHGLRVVGDHKYKITADPRGRFTTHSTLLIRVVSSRDIGSYDCAGYNQYGRKEIPIELYELKV